MSLKYLKSTALILIILGLAIYNSEAQKISFNNTIEILPGDSKERIIEKAAHVIPTVNQLDALKDEFTAFVHFGPNTFTRKEWGDGMEDPAIFDLKNLDTDQWCEAMVAAGMKKVILTVKHHDGFVIWQSRYTTHGIMSTGFRNGQGDILKELSASCQKYGLTLGIYLSPADLFQIESPTGLYGNQSKYTKRTIPREIPGRPFANKTKFQFEVDDYNEYFLNQLFELLTEYGPVHELWFDGAHPKRKGNQQYHYLAWKEMIRQLAPDAVIFGREDIRWCGNEAGGTRKTEWNVIPYMEDPNTATQFADLTPIDLGSRERLFEGKFLHYQPAETNTSIREGWFYRDDTHQKVRSADDVFDIYERAVGTNSTFLLNIPPNREGRFSDTDVSVLVETGKRIRETYGQNSLAGAKVNRVLLDDNLNTFVVLKKKKKEITVKAGNPITINRFMIQEAVSTYGERVEKHALDAWINGKWQEIATATNIGYKRILRFPEVTSNKFRLRILDSRAIPAIASLGAYFYDARPPMLTVSRNREGNVQIEPQQPDFTWNPNGENLAANLYDGMEIRFTLDGSTPNLNSEKYTGPFSREKGVIRAMAFMNGQSGPEVNETLNISKKDWVIADVDSEKLSRAAKLAIDGVKKSFWESEERQRNHFITIDLGKTYSLNAFSYTPPLQSATGMIAEGKVEISMDNQNWESAGIFEFGNLINDPSTRKYLFPKVVSGRYVKITSLKIQGGGNVAAAAEFDFFEK